MIAVDQRDGPTSVTSPGSPPYRRATARANPTAHAASLRPLAALRTDPNAPGSGL